MNGKKIIYEEIFEKEQAHPFNISEVEEIIKDFLPTDEIIIHDSLIEEYYVYITRKREETDEEYNLRMKKEEEAKKMREKTLITITPEKYKELLEIEAKYKDLCK